MRFHKITLACLILTILAGVFDADARITVRRPKPKKLKPPKVSKTDLTIGLAHYWKLDERSTTGGWADSVDPTAQLNEAVFGSIPQVSGKLNNAIQFNGLTTQYIETADQATLRINTDFAFCFWFKLSRTDVPQVFIHKSGAAGVADFEYQVMYRFQLLEFEILFPIGVVTATMHVNPSSPQPVNPGEWHFVVGWRDETGMYLSLDMGEAIVVPWTETPSTPATWSPFRLGGDDVTGRASFAVVDELAIWSGRIPTGPEFARIYNNGEGLPLEQWALTEDCRTIDCCPPDPYGYQSVDATDSEAGTNVDCVDVTIESSPASGSFVAFPTYVALTASDPDAVIRYTTDGSEPTSFSTEYTAPFQIFDAGTMVRARAFLGDCSPGTVLSVLYQNPPFPLGMAYACDTPDNGGTWGVFAPNGTVDNHWQITFTLAALTTIKRLEMYQLATNGQWTTGIMWSTNSPVTINGLSFEAMPLLLFIAAVQQHFAYQSSLGAFGAGSHTWDLYGDRQFPVSGFFRLDLILNDDSVVSAIVNATCTGTPPVACPSPTAPTVTPKCDGAVDVTFVGTVGQNYRVFYKEAGAAGSGTEAASGAMGASPTTVEVSGLTKGALYHFRVELEYTDCSYQSSIQVAGIPLPDPFVSITSDKLVVDPSESFTISWTSNNIGTAVCGGCLAGEVSLNQGLGCKAGNAAGSQATSQASPGDYTYTITGCNTCGTAVASVVVSVRNVAGCSVQPSIINVPNPSSFLCGFESGCSVGAYNITAPWNGQLPKTADCTWSLCVDGGCQAPGEVLAYISMCVYCYFSVNKWVLRVGSQAGDDGFYWTGEKLFGNSPLGTYTRTGGCATGPATITVS